MLQGLRSAKARFVKTSFAEPALSILRLIASTKHSEIEHCASWTMLQLVWKLIFTDFKLNRVALLFIYIFPMSVKWRNRNFLFYTENKSEKKKKSFFAQGIEQHKPLQSAYKSHCPTRLYQTLYTQLSILSAIMNMLFFYPVISLLLLKAGFPLPPLPLSAPSLLLTTEQLHC